MRPGTQLFQLIKSLSKAEKRHVQLYASKYKFENSKLCMQLFNVLNDLDIYDDEEIKIKLSSAKNVKLLPQMKIYLEDLILRSLRDLNSEHDPYVEVFHLLADEVILSKKGIADIRIKTLKKITVLAKKFDLNDILLIAASKQGFSVPENNYTKISKQLILASEEELKILHALQIESRLRYIFYKLWHLYRINSNTVSSKIIDQLKRDLDKESEQKLPSFITKWYFLRSYSLVYTLKNDHQQACIFHERILVLFEKNGHQKTNGFPTYQSALINYLAASHRISAYHNFENILGKLDSIKVTSVKERASIFSDAGFYHLLFLINTARFEKAAATIKSIVEDISKYKSYLQSTRIISFFHNISLFYFCNGNFNLSLDYINKALNLNESVRYDVRFKSALLELLIHLELKNTQLLKYKIRNLKTHVKKYSENKDYLSIVTKYLNRLNEAASQIEKRDLYINFEKALQKIKITHPKHKFTFIEEFGLWTCTKIKRVTLAEEMRSRLTKLHS